MRGVTATALHARCTLPPPHAVESGRRRYCPAAARQGAIPLVAPDRALQSHVGAEGAPIGSPIVTIAADFAAMTLCDRLRAPGAGRALHGALHGALHSSPARAGAA